MTSQWSNYRASIDPSPQIEWLSEINQKKTSIWDWFAPSPDLTDQWQERRVKHDESIQVVKNQTRCDCRLLSGKLMEARITVKRNKSRECVRSVRRLCSIKSSGDWGRRGRSPLASLMNTLTDLKTHPPDKLNTHYCSRN